MCFSGSLARWQSDTIYQIILQDSLLRIIQLWILQNLWYGAWRQQKQIALQDSYLNQKLSRLITVRTVKLFLNQWAARKLKSKEKLALGIAMLELRATCWKGQWNLTYSCAIMPLKTDGESNTATWGHIGLLHLWKFFCK